MADSPADLPVSFLATRWSPRHPYDAERAQRFYEGGLLLPQSPPRRRRAISKWRDRGRLSATSAWRGPSPLWRLPAHRSGLRNKGEGLRHAVGRWWLWQTQSRVIETAHAR